MSDNDMENPREDERSDKDEPILLTEEVSPDDGDLDAIELIEEVSPDNDGEEIIELTEEVPPDDGDLDVIELAEEMPPDDGDLDAIELIEEVLPDNDGEEIIELTEEVPVDAEDSDGFIIDLVDATDDDQAGSGIEADGSIQISPRQLEKALEKTVEKIYGDRIENLLIEVVQKKVSVEIEKIKKTLKMM